MNIKHLLKMSLVVAGISVAQAHALASQCPMSTEVDCFLVGKTTLNPGTVVTRTSTTGFAVQGGITLYNSAYSGNYSVGETAASIIGTDVCAYRCDSGLNINKALNGGYPKR